MTQLRDYQLSAISEARASVERGCNAPLIVMPCGAGKTRTASEIVRSHVSFGGTVVWLAHRRELLGQAARQLRAVGLRVGGLPGIAEARLDPSAPVQVCSVQTLVSRGVAPRATMVVLDEARHFASDEWSKLIAMFGGALRVGLDATPARADGRALGDIFDDIIVATTIRELTEQGHLCPLEIVGPNRVLPPGQIAAKPVDAYLAHCAGRETIVFAPHIKAAKQFAEEFKAAGVAVELVTGTMPAGQRARALASRAVLINVGICTEGFDRPSIECCILARRCGSVGLFIQMVGRALRPSPGKTAALLVDLTGMSLDQAHGRPDADREYSLEGKGIVEKDDVATLPVCRVCGSNLEDDATTCEGCGTARPTVTMPEITGERLSKYDRIRRDNEDMQARRLAKWIGECAGRMRKDGKPYSKYAAYFKFKAVYGVDPPQDVIRAANGILKGVA